MLYLALITVLSQTEVPVAAAEVSAAASAERAAVAAERAAAAAQKAAEAVQRLAELQAGLVPASAAAAAAEEPKKDPWKGMVSVGLIALFGNAETLTGTMSAQLDKKFGNWGFGARASGAYGQTRPPAGGAADVTAYRAGLLLRGDRNIGSFASIYALGGLETDHVKSVELRGFGELGAGIKFYERKDGELERVFLRGDIGFRASHETRYQYYADKLTPANTKLPDVSMIGPRIGIVFRYALNKDVRFSEEAEFLPNVLSPSRFIFNSSTKLSARLTESLAMTGSFLVNFDSAPAPGKKDTDSALVLGLEAAF